MCEKTDAPPAMTLPFNEERLSVDDENWIVIRFTGSAAKMYDFLAEYLDFRRKRMNGE